MTARAYRPQTFCILGVAALLNGCGNDASGDKTPYQDLHRGTGGTTIGVGDNGTGGTSGGGAGSGEAGTHGGTGGKPGGGQVGDPCGGFVANAQACAPGLYCEGPFPDLACNPDVGGTCRAKPQVCDAIYAPVCGCDRKTYSSDCVRQGAGVSKLSDGECPKDGGGSGGTTGGGGKPGTGSGGATGGGGKTGSGGASASGGAGGRGEAGVGESCGGFTTNARPCAKGLFCEGPFPDLACNPDVGGTCRAKPDVCTAIYAPVCGCDRKTYSSDCVRQGAGVSKLSDGECPKDGGGSGGSSGGGGSKGSSGGSGGGLGEGEQCGGFAANVRTCAKGLFCEGPFPDNACAPDIGGTCQKQPEACTKDYQPVCGCDCKTYGNDCTRKNAGVSKRADGECASVKGC